MPFYECSSDCNTRGMQIPASCELSPRDGGISRLVFVPIGAGITVNNADQLNTWVSAINECNIYITGRLKGQKPKHTTTSEKLTSCLPEQITGATKTISFLDYNAYDGLEFDFWDAIYQEQTLFKVMAIGCDGRIYPLTDFTLDIDEIIPEDSKSPSYFDGVISFDNDGSIVKPFYWPDLLDALLTQQCNCSPYIDCASRPGFAQFEVRIPENFVYDPESGKNFDITLACCDSLNGDGCYGTTDYMEDYFGLSAPNVWGLNSWESVSNFCPNDDDYECILQILFSGINNANFSAGLGTFTYLGNRTALFELEISKLQYTMPECFSGGVNNFCNGKSPLKICPVTNFQSDADNCPYDGFLKYSFTPVTSNEFPTFDGATPYTVVFDFQSDCGNLPSLPGGYTWTYTVPDATSQTDYLDKLKVLIDADIVPIGGYTVIRDPEPDRTILIYIPLSEFAGLDPECLCNNCISDPPGRGFPTALMQTHTAIVNGSPVVFGFNASCCACNLDPSDFAGVPGSICFPRSEGQEGDPPTPTDCDITYTITIFEEMLNGAGSQLTISWYFFDGIQRNPDGTSLTWTTAPSVTNDMFEMISLIDDMVDAELTGAGIPYSQTSNNTVLVNGFATYTFTINTMDAFSDPTSSGCNCTGTQPGFGEDYYILAAISDPGGNPQLQNELWVAVDCCDCTTPVAPEQCEHPGFMRIEGCVSENRIPGETVQAFGIVWPDERLNSSNERCIPYKGIGNSGLSTTWQYTIPGPESFDTSVQNWINQVEAAYAADGITVQGTILSHSPGVQTCFRFDIAIEQAFIGEMYSPAEIDAGCGCSCLDGTHGQGQLTTLMMTRTYIAHSSGNSIDPDNNGPLNIVELSAPNLLECCDCDEEQYIYEQDENCQHPGAFLLAGSVAPTTFTSLVAGDIVYITYLCAGDDGNGPNNSSYVVQGGDTPTDILNGLVAQMNTDFNDFSIFLFFSTVDGSLFSINVPFTNGNTSNPTFSDKRCDCYCQGVANNFGYNSPNWVSELVIDFNNGDPQFRADIEIQCCDCSQTQI